MGASLWSVFQKNHCTHLPVAEFYVSLSVLCTRCARGMFLYFACSEPEEQQHLQLCVNPVGARWLTSWLLVLPRLSGYLLTTILSALCFLVIHEISAAVT